MIILGETVRNSSPKLLHQNIGTGHENTLHSGSGCVPLSNFPDTRYRLVGPPQPASTCVTTLIHLINCYKYDLIVVCR